MTVETAGGGNQGPPSTRLCKHCKHFRLVSATCEHPEATKYDLVWGGTKQVSAEVARSTDVCGPNAVLFEPKETVH